MSEGRSFGEKLVVAVAVIVAIPFVVPPFLGAVAIIPFGAYLIWTEVAPLAAVGFVALVVGVLVWRGWTRRRWRPN